MRLAAQHSYVLGISLFIFCKGFQRSFYWNEYNIKHENKNTPNEYRYFLESNFVRVNRHVNRIFVLVYTNEGDNAKRFKTRQNY